MEGALIILIFVGVIILTAVLFGFWVVANLIRVTLRGIGALFRGNSPVPALTAQARCGNERCRAENPAAARFCRRCGQPLKTTPAFARISRAAAL